MDCSVQESVQEASASEDEAEGPRSLEPKEYPCEPLLRPWTPLGTNEVTLEVLRWRTQRLEAWENWNGLVAPELRSEPGAAMRSVASI